MSGTTMIYLKNSARVRLKALAYLDDRPLIDYIEVISRKLVEDVPPSKYRKAVEAVTDGNPENA